MAIGAEKFRGLHVKFTPHLVHFFPFENPELSIAFRKCAWYMRQADFFLSGHDDLQSECTRRHDRICVFFQFAFDPAT
ncbi:hypothetical protein NXS19_010002 [Fusarium pseudograminearum]|nr:hypothetical protein NXS19_010002 [Fusarium pseudograminearum]